MLEQLRQQKINCIVTASSKDIKKQKCNEIEFKNIYTKQINK